MARQTAREVERDTYEQPDPDVPWVALTLEGAGLARRTLIRHAQAAGFQVFLFGSIAHGPADWRKRRPDDEVTHYYAVRQVSFRLSGQRPLPEGELGLVAFDVRWPGPLARVMFRGWPWRKASIAELTNLLKGLAS